MAQAVEQLRQTRRNYAFVVANDGRLLGAVSLDTLLRGLESGASRLESAFTDGMEAVPASLNLRELIARIVRQPLPLPVVDTSGRYLGAVTQTILLKKMMESESKEQLHE
jgi:glycine betaine/proline transport system ATP-binding protein